jgi:hypothetical protein
VYGGGWFSFIGFMNDCVHAYQHTEARIPIRKTKYWHFGGWGQLLINSRKKEEQEVFIVFLTFYSFETHGRWWIKQSQMPLLTNFTSDRMTDWIRSLEMEFLCLKYKVVLIFLQCYTVNTFERSTRWGWAVPSLVQSGAKPALPTCCVCWGYASNLVRIGF